MKKLSHARILHAFTRYFCTVVEGKFVERYHTLLFTVIMLLCCLVNNWGKNLLLLLPTLPQEKQS